VWNSFHDNKPEGAIRNKHWYEFDALAGIEFGIGPLTAGVGYIYFHSPANAFDDIHELELKLNLDDSKYLPIALNPFFQVNFELRDNGGTEDTYAATGIEPSFEGNFRKVPVTVSLPLTFGLSFDDYYTDKKGQNEFLGYISVAGVASVPLPIRWGEWTLSAKVEYLYLDSFSVRAANRNNKSNQVIGTLGIAVAF
jgi:hypothetical protein